MSLGGWWQSKSADRHIAFVVFTVVATAVVSVAPSTTFYTRDPDAGTQLAYALMIFHGSHPYIDVPTSVGGPLIFYASALFQWLFNHAVLGEVVLCTLGYAFGYLAFYVTLRTESNSRLYALLGTAIAVLLLPRFYKYYVVALPMLVLISMHAWYRRPTRRRLLITGTLISVTAFFRVDIGVLSALGIATGILLHPDLTLRSRLTCLPALAAPALLAGGLWFTWLAWSGDLLATLRLNASLGRALGSGMSLPFPAVLWTALDTRHGAFSLAVWVFLFVPAALLAYLSLSPWWKEQPLSRSFGLFLAAFAALLFAQAWHRTDYAHFLQAAPLTLFAIFWTCGRRFAESGTRLGVAGRFAALVPLAVLMFPLANTRAMATGLSSLPARVTEWRVPAADWIYEKPHDGEHIAQAIRRLRQYTRSQDAIFVLGYAPQIYYFADRPFPGIFSSLLPGVLDIPELRTSLYRTIDESNVIVHLPWQNFALSEADSGLRRKMFVADVYDRFGIASQRGPILLLIKNAGPVGGRHHFPSAFAAINGEARNPASHAQVAVNFQRPGTDVEVERGYAILVTTDDGSVLPDSHRCVLLHGQGGYFVSGPAVFQLRQRGRMAEFPGAIGTGAVLPGNYLLYLQDCDGDSVESTGIEITIVDGHFH